MKETLQDQVFAMERVSSSGKKITIVIQVTMIYNWLTYVTRILTEESLLLDQGFQLPSVPTTTTEAHSAAVRLKEWMELADNQAELEGFSSRLVLDLNQFLPPTADPLTKTKKETMWRKYYQYRISGSFQSLWKEFVQKCLSHTYTRTHTHTPAQST